MTPQAAGPPVHVRAAGLAKSFGPVRALRRADLTVTAGRISALVGENGAGKSTLMQLISGDLSPDAGALDVGVRVGLVRQQLSTVDELSLLENIVFGAEDAAGTGAWPGRLLGGISWSAHKEGVRDLMARTGIVVPLAKPAAEVPVGVRQRVDILSALYRGARCLLLDEPTTYLTPREVDTLFEVMRDLAAGGMSVVFISHRLREVVQHCDEVNVLRRGESVLHLPAAPFELGRIGRAMTGGDDAAGGEATGAARPAGAPPGVPVLDVGGRLSVRAGEIVGIAGVSGNGQNELLDTIAGLQRSAAHLPLTIDGREVSRWSTRARRAAGLRFIPESVKESGSAPAASITDNVISAVPPPGLRGRLGLLRRGKADQLARSLVERARVVASSTRQPASELSGGNLQRVAVARELGDGARILLAHEPTRGVDFAGVALIHAQLREFTSRGGAVLLVTSDVDELLALSDRVHVIDRGRLGRDYERDELTLGRLGELLGGLGHDVAAARHEEVP
ncbi:ATP-binding cassette domain-containing protein [Jiangella alba]|uniref:Simple sugar transport system ATP-binding protein n=1 Tax=Jiangella alba TaxID=561176 RepID=A0A1H5PW79_9ACTN|nr:ATP-binding cassette domain-containing protein [Jiangella alba]SEF18122.1 simple sugar transport system ATP-binding protein [Jiangella alba]